MSFTKTITALIVGLAIASATPTQPNAAQPSGVQGEFAQCGGLGPCYENNCAPVFSSPDSTVGICSSGDFQGCSCDKCGSKIGPCNGNNCYGINGKCSSGPYQGCLCR